jgi:hypothetical protein
MSVLGPISSLNFLLRSQHLDPNTLIPNYRNPAYLETIQFAFLGVAMLLHIIYVLLHCLIIIVKTQ